MHRHINGQTHPSPRIGPARTLSLVKKAPPGFQNHARTSLFQWSKSWHDRSDNRHPVAAIGLAAPIHGVEDAVPCRTIDMQMHMFMLKAYQTFERPALAAKVLRLTVG
jgi:hypothetical protein